MKQFTYTITDPVGIHARPAGMLAKAAKALDSTVTISKADGSKSAVATKLMAVMGLGVKTGETITFTIEGGDEEASAAAMEQFCKDNM
ncbi:HPr family phosphocarrier protein [uncultured Oscillibacter sp.]|uniref:HPr family phosphocarrier protein n=1 Tax=uncultured Oscillibacter sp. TaxID=876091 RepID=UPI0025E77B3E|nr:HPr family phosphocarrier protein [uncultured Oscillibacter sp.]